MRALILLSVLLLPACTPESAVATNAASVVVFQRAIPDLLISGVIGRDCSVVRLAQGTSYCKPEEPPPAVPEFCTRSLGVVDCWADPAALSDQPHEVADGPRVLTPAQEADRTKRWPGL
jgi:hypothetical protein